MIIWNNPDNPRDMTQLSVNINKVATLRNARGGNVPNVVQVALDCERFGAEGITVHPRPDERHIRYADVYALRPVLTTEFNIEGYPSEPFVKLVTAVKPAQVTLVPDPPDALTSNAGWDTVSIFVDTDLKHLEYARRCGTDRVELYTEPYAAHYAADRERAVAPFVQAAQSARDLGLGLNAGHDLSLDNLAYLHSCIPWLDEVSIGHALISDALYFGLADTIKRYREQLGKK